MLDKLSFSISSSHPMLMVESLIVRGVMAPYINKIIAALILLSASFLLELKEALNKSS